MEYLMELIVELIYKGSIEGVKRNTPKFIKIPLVIILVLFFLTVIALILGTGFLMLKNNITIYTFLFIAILLINLIYNIILTKKLNERLKNFKEEGEKNEK